LRELLEQVIESRTDGHELEVEREREKLREPQKQSQVSFAQFRSFEAMVAKAKSREALLVNRVRPVGAKS